MLLTLEKLDKRTREVEKRRYVRMESVTPFLAAPGGQDRDQVYTQVPEITGNTRMEVGENFDGFDRYLWMQTDVTVPAHEDGLEAVGLFDFGNTGGGGNSGFEAMLYVNGCPYQGVDSNHRDVVFESMAGEPVRLTFLLWTGLNGGPSKEPLHHRIQRAEIGYLHKDTDEFYYLSRAIVETAKLIPDEQTEKQDLIRALDQAYCLVNWDEDKFYNSVGEALAYVNGALETMEKTSKVTVHCVGHTHIDVAWLWRLKHTREKAMRSFSTVLRLMDEFDEYVFLQSQPQLYDYIKQDQPQIYEGMKRRAAEGRWEADGGMWLEADCNISSGEALSRQFLQGIRFLKEEFGHECRFLWLPDVFGYSWALPQIMKQCGIKSFATTKISWNQFNTMPHDLFWWRGMDGTEIMTYFINTPEPDQPMDSRFATYNGLLTPQSVLGSWKKFKDKEISRDTLISYGYGDGGGGVNRDMLKMRRAMDRLPGLPAVKTGKAGEFFDLLHDRMDAAGEQAAVWDGERYLEYHRGTYTSQAHNKKMNRYLEFALAESEWLSSMAALAGGKSHKQELKEGWKIVLRNQFHDIIPGSSIHEVYEDSAKEYEEACRIEQEVRTSALSCLTVQEEGAYCVYNTTSLYRCDPVFVPGEDGLAFTGPDGEAAASQRTEGGYLLKVPMEPLSMKTVRAVSVERVSEEELEAAQPLPFVFDPEGVLETPFYRLAWDLDGNFSSIYDKTNDREVIKEGGRGNVLEVYEDRPLNYDNWDIDIFYMQKKETFRLIAPVEVLEMGGLRAVLRFRRRYNLSEIVQDVIVYADSGRIDFKTKVSWHEDCRLLKASFETSVRSQHASYDIQYGHVERPTHYNTSWDYARFEVVGHKWADLSETNYGVSLLNDCKYGYSIKDHVMKLSLLKSTKYPDDRMDMGEHEFTYSLYPHAGSVTEGGTVREGVCLNQPLHGISGCRAALKYSAFTVTDVNGNPSDAVLIDAVKEAEGEDCLILRFHECLGGSHKIRIQAGIPMKEWCESNILEESCGEYKSCEDGRMEFALHPFEIRTVKIR